MTYKTEMEAAFEEWFQHRRRKTWAETRMPDDPIEPRSAWSTGLYKHFREGWMGAVLWCRLCKREHEGPCISEGKTHG